MTPEQMQRATGVPPAVATRWAALLSAAMAEFGVNTPARQAAFLAQVGHESGGFAYTREVWGPTPAQSHYEGRTDLGNTHAGDGYAYRGRGLIQITGRANYVACGDALGIDCVTTPGLLEQPAFAAQSAAWYWDEHGLNELADVGNFDTITRRVNGGRNGEADRRRRWALAKQALGVV